MKKALSLVLALCLVLGMAAACADGLAVGTYDPASAGDVTLNFAWWGNQVRDEVTKAAADYFTAAYPNVTMNLNSQNWNDYWSLMLSNGANNDLPDVMQQDYAKLDEWVNDYEYLLDLTPYIESGALDVSGIPESSLASGKVGDGIYAIVCAVNAPAMLYNKTLTDSLGIEVPMNITWDEFVEISKKIYAETGVRTLYGDGDSENPLMYYARSLGYESLWGAEGVVPTVEEMTAYYARLIDGVAEGWLFDTDTIAALATNTIDQYPLVYGSDPSVRAWCSVCFSNQIAAYQKAADADNIELGISTWPSLNPSASNYLKPGQFFAVTSQAKNPDLSVAFLNYLLNDVEANIILKAERGVPPVTGVAAAIADVVSAAQPTYAKTVEYLAIVGENSSPIFPALPAWNGQAQTEAIKPLSEECMTKGTTITAAEAAQQLVEKVADIVSQY